MELSSYCPLDVLETRQEISNEIRRVVNLVTAEPGIVPVGTFRYNIFKYPGDIDIFEELETCCEFSTAKLTAAQKIQSIVQNITSHDTVLFVEFKAGYDLRFKLYTGVVNDKIEDYNPELIRRDITNLYEAGLLSECEWNALIILVKDDPNVDDLIALNDALRAYWVVRWKEEEVLQGYKLLPGNYKLFLDVALAQGTIVKLDTIAYIDDRFVEVTNFFLVAILDKLGQRILISQELGEYEQSLILDVYKYYSINPLKSIKRLWMYLAFNKRICDISMFTDLFSSDIALYSQILSDIETAINILSSDLWSRFSTMYEPTVLYESLNTRLQLVHGLCSPAYYGSQPQELIVEDLKRLQSCLREQINALTYEWLAARNINIFSLITPQAMSPSALLANEAAD